MIAAAGGFLSRIFGIGGARNRAPQREVRMCVLGLDNAGKTTILRSLAHEEIHTVQPTQGFNVKSLRVSNFSFNVWDLGGQMAIREHWKNYYENLDCVIFVVDSSDNRRMEDECGGELQKLLVEDKLAGVPILVFANKQDLELAMPADEIEEVLHLSQINDRPWSIQACSAQSGEGKLIDHAIYLSYL
mmetsp:Transcript_25927/g.30318  ORF Transcript_25927/g.30318 Transcript_25927/m.30318 type:complete len:188 (+) Transcript_25927:36-599(+)